MSTDILQEFPIEELPTQKFEESEHGGEFLYAIELSNGTVKIGVTQHPATRLRTHERTAIAHGLSVYRCLVAPQHSTARKHERELMALSGDGKSEYLQIPFEEVTKAVAGMDFPPVKHSDQSANVEALIGLTKALWSGQIFPDPNMNHVESLAFIVHRAINTLDFAVDEIGGNCECDNGNVEDALEELMALRDTIRDTANLAVENFGGSLNEYRDGTPVEPSYYSDENGKHASIVRRKSDPVEIPQDLLDWANTPNIESVSGGAA